LTAVCGDVTSLVDRKLAIQKLGGCSSQPPLVPAGL
jgi:hypothetical protein